MNQETHKNVAWTIWARCFRTH